MKNYTPEQIMAIVNFVNDFIDNVSTTWQTQRNN